MNALETTLFNALELLYEVQRDDLPEEYSPELVHAMDIAWEALQAAKEHDESRD